MSSHNLDNLYMSQCSNAPGGLGFDAQAPVGMLCAVDYWDGTSSALYYVNGQLARMLDPGNEVTDFGYVSVAGTLRLRDVREPVQSDWVAIDPTNRNHDGSRTVVNYNSVGKATNVALASNAGVSNDPNRESHSYNYLSGETRVSVAGFNPPQGFARRAYFDAGGRVTTETDAVGANTIIQYDGDDNVLLTRNEATTRQTTTFYDQEDRVVESYGPALASCFGANRLPNGSCAASAVPRNSTVYDGNLPGGNYGLAASFWATNNFAGGTKHHEHMFKNGTGNLLGSWNQGVPPNVPVDDFTVRMEGKIRLDSVGSYQFAAYAGDGLRIYIDDILVATHWPNEPDYGVLFNNTVAGSWHKIRLDFVKLNSVATFEAKWIPPGGSLQYIPTNLLKPNYGLQTQSTTHDSTTGSPSSVTNTVYSNAAYGLVGSQVVNPGPLDLTTQSAYESATGAGFMRQISKTLPAGNVTSYTYYGNTEVSSNPCGGPSVNQGGLMKQRINPAPASGPQIVENFYYDRAGRVVAAWNTGDAPTCSVYDSRGRPTTVTVPAYGAGVLRTVTSDYKTTTDPLSTSVTDAAGTITSTTDLNGKTKTHTDVWGRTTTSTYDQAGRPIDSASPGDVRRTEYDQYGRPQFQRVGTDTASLKYVSDVAFDGASEPTSVTFWPNSQNAAWEGNDTAIDMTRDGSGRTTGVNVRPRTASAWGSTYITRDQVGYSQSGRVVEQSIDTVDARSGGNNFVYDGAGRLTTAYVPGHQLGYSFASNSCGGPNRGKNTNRTQATDNGSTIAEYCYDNADRLTSVTGMSAPSYDSHGNTVDLNGSTMTYDMANRHLSTTSNGSTVSYVRDATDRIVERKVDGNTVARYSYCGSGDSPCATLDVNNNVVERVIGLPGGVTLTKRSTGDVWSYSNIHGDVVATTNTAGVKQGNTLNYDPFGQLLNGATPDNSAGNFDYGWLGKHQRVTETEAGLGIIEMGARQYSPSLGRFLSVDPIEGGSANDYDYVEADPVNGIDADGTRTRKQNTEMWQAVSKFCLHSAQKCLKARTNGNQAASMASRYFTFGTKQWDAFKHVYWHALNVVSGLGGGWSFLLGVAYENYSNNQDGYGDKVNNLKGVFIGLAYRAGHIKGPLSRFVAYYVNVGMANTWTNCFSCPNQRRQ